MPEENQRPDRDSDETVAPKDRPSSTARQPAGRGPGDHPVKLHSPLFPLLWLLFPFLAMVTYGLLTRR
jgi:hypothetical protein